MHYEKYALGIALAGMICFASQAQVMINEASNKNYSTISAGPDANADWIELYNSGSTNFNLQGYHLSDNLTEPAKFTFPYLTVVPNGFFIALASDTSTTELIDHWETAVFDTSMWSYLTPSVQLPSDWNTVSFDASSWSTGMGSIGYGDGDDNTIVPNGTLSVYMVKHFTIPDVTKLASAWLSIDYDDGFVAYLNGVEIGRSGLIGNPPAYDELATDHEAVMYQGYNPEEFEIDSAVWQNVLVNGDNVLAVEVHNSSPFSSDLSCRPFLTFGIVDGSTSWSTPPSFFNHPTNNYLFLNFGINQNGETVYLFDTANILLDSLRVTNLDLNQSIGRFPDGANNSFYFGTPTPGSSNLNPSIGYEPDPQFSVLSGYYAGSVTAALSSSSSTSVIHYELSGQTPTLVSPVYSIPITFTSTQCLSARCFSTANLLPSKTISETFLVNENFTVPVINIITEDTNLFGPTGIYDNWWEDWKRPCTIQYFDTLHQLAFTTHAAIKIDGGWGGSRYAPQHSFRLEPSNDVMGDGVLHYPLIPARTNLNEYETFYLRNGSNQYLGMIYKDAFMGRSLNHSLTNYQEYTPVVAFIDGIYWGVYELREKQDKGYFHYNYGIDETQLDLLSLSAWYYSVLRTLEGSADDFYYMINWFASNNPGSPQFYSVADSMLDVKSYSDYIIGETWYGNYDWPNNNIKIWRGHNTDNKWHFGIQDLELCLPPNGWNSVSDDNLGYVLGIGGNNGFVLPFNQLIQNSQFRNYFINRFADLMNTIFLPDTLITMCNKMHNQLLPEMPKDYARWGDTTTYTITDYMNYFNDQKDQLIAVLPLRSDYLRQYMLNDFGLQDTVTITLQVQPAGAGQIQISTVRPSHYPWSGIYFNGNSVTVTAYANPGYLFNHWSNSQYIGNTNAQSFTANILNHTSFTAHFTPVAPPDVVVSEINYNSEASVNAGDWFELHNNGTAPVDLSGWYVKDQNDMNRFDFPFGTILFPGSYLVLAEDTFLFHQQHPAITNVMGSIGFGLSSSGDEIRLYDILNNIQSQVQYNVYLPWPIGANGHGRTLELKDPAQSLNDPTNWFDGCIGGSPGTAYSPCNDAFVVSEINYHSFDTLNTEDWIELYNISASPIDLTGYTLQDAGDSNVYVLPAENILPGQRLMLIQDTIAFQLFHPNVGNHVGPFAFGLGGDGDWIRMYDPAHKLVTSIDYRDVPPWPMGADGYGYTLELADSMGVMNDGANWFAGCIGGSPGTAFIPCVTAVGEAASSQQLHVFPVPANDVLNIQSATSGTYELVDVAGRKVKAGMIHSGITAFSVSDLSVGLYALTVNLSGGKQHYIISVAH